MKQREAAFRRELVCLLPRLWRFGMSLTGAADACHDLVQATCERALTHYPQWRAGSRLDSWTFAIMHSIWKNELRARAIRRGAGFVDPETYPLPATAQVEDDAAAAELYEAVAALPEAQRAALLLVYVEGYGYREAAQILDIPIGTVMSRLARASHARRTHAGAARVRAADDATVEDAMNPLDETILLAYVDGQLAPDEMQRVEAALQTDASAREIVRRLRATPEQLRTVFDRTLDRPLPPTLAAAILQHPTERRALPRIRMTYAIALGVLLFGMGLGTGVWLDGARRTATVEPWVAAVADYQALYGRATVAGTDVNGVELHELARRLSAGFGRAVTIPDLRAHGLAFTRGQLLEFAGQPLVQLVYLPVQGKPIALCQLKTAHSNLAPTPGIANGMRYVQWRTNGVAYLLIGDTSASEMEKLAAAARAS